MDGQNFQTSFIPKKPMIEARVVSGSRASYLTVFSVFIFFTIILATGALYFYNGVLAKNIIQMESDLNLSKNRFEPSKIVQLQVLDKRLRASDEILAKHIAISPIFKELQTVTMQTIGYTKFTYDLTNSKNGLVMIKLDGVAVGYRSVALQSDLFAKNKNFIDPIFSNLSLDDKGNVLFELEFGVDANFVNYKKLIEVTEANTGAQDDFADINLENDLEAEEDVLSEEDLLNL